MLQTIWQRIDRGARRLLPLATALLFTLAGVVAWPLPHLGPVMPSLALTAVYYWAVHRPDLFRAGSALAVGLLYDVVNYYPLGLSALIFVAVHQLVLSQRRFFVHQVFFMLWLGFGLVMLLAYIAHGLILSVYQHAWVAMRPGLLQAVLSVVIFPLPAWVLIRLQRAALSQG